MNELTPPK